MADAKQTKTKVRLEYTEGHKLIRIESSTSEELKKLRERAVQAVCVVTEKDGEIVSHRTTHVERAYEALVKAGQ